MNAPKSRPSVAVVIATCDRLQLLAWRSLPSVVAQTRAPDYLIVVDDSFPGVRPNNADCVESLKLPGCEILYLENQRTKGASGTWNTALDLLMGKVGDPSKIFVAFLDDDDAWSPDYLESCCTAACDQQLDMVAADLRRFESVNGQPFVAGGPEVLCAGQFFTGNPGIQGSNLFVRLSVLMAAGGFDEALQSTTDRDLCIRIADLGTVRYGRLPVALVDHFAEPDRSRLSIRGSQAKVDGLTAFWQKYVGRMTADQRASFSERAAMLFSWHPPRNVTITAHADVSKRALVLGLIADNAHPEDLFYVVRQLAGWNDETLVGLDVVLLEQGQLNQASTLVEQAAMRLRDSGVSCFRFSLERQEEVVRMGLFSCDTAEFDRPVSEIQREVLLAYCGRVASSRPGAEIWIAMEQRIKEQHPDGSQVEDVLRWLSATRADSSIPTISNTASVAVLDQWIQCERIATAEHRIRHRFSLDSIRLLGYGSEAVVFTDEHTVYKCIDYWKTRMPKSQLEFLKGQIGRWSDTPGMYPLREVLEDGPWVILTYDYETSLPYEGGHEASLVRLLSGCSAAGIVCNNIHPKNLVVTPSGVHLIDYGSDIRPWTILGFEQMARKAFLSCHFAAHPDLKALLRRALSEDGFPEMAGYKDFRRQLEITMLPQVNARITSMDIAKAPPHKPFRLYVGIISSDPAMLKPLLHSLASLRGSDIEELSVLILDNGSSTDQLNSVVREVRNKSVRVAIVDEARQRRDAAAGSFGSDLLDRSTGQVGIASARTMLQRYLGALLASDPDSFGWILDDDMRVDARARAYLPWLPAFHEQGTDVLIGFCEGSSPNPPLNGIRVHLLDLLHNIHWLRNLPPDAILPDRTAENEILRARYPDYYYDLSRKHTAHLEMPHWLEPAVPGEMVREAYSRLLAGAIGILSGDPLTRPIIVNMPFEPLASAMDSVNRGGNTFILNHYALTQTPNMIMRLQGRDVRRSDMIWAVVNRYYRRMTIKAVGFPVIHLGRVTATPRFDVEKVQDEIIGSTLYAGITEFLSTRPRHELNFSLQEIDEIQRLMDRHLDRRWRMLQQSFYRIAGLREAIRRLARPGELEDLVGYLDHWFTQESFERIRSTIPKHNSNAVENFLSSLRVVADDFERTTINIEFIQTQLTVGYANNASGRL